MLVVPSSGQQTDNFSHPSPTFDNFNIQPNEINLEDSSFEPEQQHGSPTNPKRNDQPV